MKTVLYFLTAIACLALSGHAQSPTDVPEVGAHEIARRGNWVEQTGTIRSGLMAAAFAPPADDSSKWFVTLVVQPGQAESDRMRNMIANDQAVRPWINANDPKTSTTHYQIRSVTDSTQKDWMAGLKPAIDKVGLPIVVLQPPRNGHFGKPETIVKMLHGVMSGKDLADKLRDGVMAYVATLEEPIQVGVAQPAEKGRVAPPFNVPDRAPPPPLDQQPNPFEWPPATPKELTIEQIRTACPGATPDFIMSVISAKDTNLDVVALRWAIYQKDHPAAAPSEEEPVTHPIQPAPQIPTWLLALTMFLGAFALLVLLDRLKSLVMPSNGRGDETATAHVSTPSPTPNKFAPTKSV